MSSYDTPIGASFGHMETESGGGGKDQRDVEDKIVVQIPGYLNKNAIISCNCMILYIISENDMHPNSR